MTAKKKKVAPFRKLVKEPNVEMVLRYQIFRRSMDGLLQCDEDVFRFRMFSTVEEALDALNTQLSRGHDNWYWRTNAFLVIPVIECVCVD